VEEMEQYRLTIAGSCFTSRWTRAMVRRAAPVAAADLAIPCSDRRSEVTAVLLILLLDPVVSSFLLLFYYLEGNPGSIFLCN
jgi:hypothetical protein